MSDHEVRTRFSAELDEDIRKMSKDNRIIEQNVLEKRLTEENELYEKYGVVPEVSEETHKKALEIMKEMGLEGRGDEDNSTHELNTAQTVDTSGE
ncbi:hypothetical protein [Rickettsiales endosymbiont of Trichoplax sp. H2]|uniref:hypothetical protein n=1 Tax=Rickettsiales endosymbiont of Trichoplax sp. H2 TaxID=2021221 RepID=UPI0012B237E5|nr:hypothetical protein [Rickettsiales endosymbiont of Trichoplax sp. H2]MSO14603.1 hypothetical protein [Rickettsiales endosymbiont of Trichoplax sp. H2]